MEDSNRLIVVVLIVLPGMCLQHGWERLVAHGVLPQDGVQLLGWDAILVGKVHL